MTWWESCYVVRQKVVFRRKPLLLSSEHPPWEAKMSHKRFWSQNMKINMSLCTTAWSVGRGSTPPRILNLGTKVSKLTLAIEMLRTNLSISEVTKLRRTCKVYTLCVRTEIQLCQDWSVILYISTWPTLCKAVDVKTTSFCFNPCNVQTTQYCMTNVSLQGPRLRNTHV